MLFISCYLWIVLIIITSQISHSNANWKLILEHKNTSIGNFNASIRITGVKNANDAKANTYSIIGNINTTQYLINGTYKFKLIYYNDATSISEGKAPNHTLIWRQSSWITESFTNSNPTGYEAISMPTFVSSRAQNNFYFVGLSLSSSSDYVWLDGIANGVNSFRNAVGSFGTSTRGNIPGYDEAWATGQQLYIYYITRNPTTDPTTEPTTEPTEQPSISPTTCKDLDDKPSNDGDDIIEPYSEILNQYIQPLYTKMYNTLEHSQLMDCSNEDICYIKCNDTNSCNDQNIIVSNSNQNEPQNTSIMCLSTKSCDSLTFTITNSTVYSINILCNYTDSCSSLSTNIQHSDVHIFNIYCVNKWSCYSMQLSMTKSNIAHTNIFCIDGNGCDDLYVAGDHGVSINLNMYEYSKNIKIVHPNITHINVTCDNPNNKRYIEYDIQQIPTERELLSLAEKEYDSRTLPCDGIEIDCSSNVDVDTSCITEYSLKSFDLSSLIKTRDYTECYWFDINDLFDVVCDGNCYHDTVYYQYNNDAHYDITFRFDSVCINHNCTSAEDRALRICDKYFGTMNISETTLNSMDAIFENILNTISPDDPNGIHDALKTPSTILRNELMYFNCSPDFETLKITTNFSLESANDNEDEIDEIFNDDGEFTLRAAWALSQFFQVNLTMDRVFINNVINEDEGFNWQSILLIAASVIIAMISFCIYCIRRRKQEAKTQYIRNAKVITLAIGSYDKDPTQEMQERIGGRLRDLDGVHIDIENVVELYGNTLNYKIYPKYDTNGKIKQYWTYDEIMDLLENQAIDFEDNVVKFDKDGNTTSGIYDGLVVIISCHGIKDYIITSDYRKINKTRINRIFSKEYPPSRYVPRLFLLDCCDGSHARRDDHRGHESSIDEDSDNIIKQNDEEEEIAQNRTATMKETGDRAHDTALEYKEDGEGIIAMDINKFDAVKHAKTGKSMSQSPISYDGSWYRQEVNPDFKLIEIRAANEGFQAILDSATGSHVITRFTQLTIENIKEKNNKKFLFKITQKIQNELHKANKQLPIYTFNNGTEYVKFVKNAKNQRNNESMTEEKDEEHENAEMTYLKNQENKPRMNEKAQNKHADLIEYQKSTAL